MPRFYLGIDVGTSSARAAVFDDTGRMVGSGSHPIQIFRPQHDFAEHSSDDIWRSVGAAAREALATADVPPTAIAGVGVDATCSLVVLDANDRPVTVSPTGDDAQNVIVWMDHRAIAEAARINATKHEVLKYVGGRVSPEMQTPKLLWLEQHAPATWKRARRFFDLPDFLVYRATGVDVRSLCTTTCKWTYMGHGLGWDGGFFGRIGLGELVDENYARIGTKVRPMGERAGLLTETSARELGLAAGTPVAVAIIDAHAGGLGTIGVTVDGARPTQEQLEERLALICGTSTCHMAVSREASFVPGVWGPYFSAMVPGMWLSEGGQSATGALVDHVITSHVRGAELTEQARREGTTPYALLNARLDVLAKTAPFPAALTRDLHVLPYHHGNRSPRADPTLRGMVSGLTLSDSLDSLALLYLATIQAIAHGTRHIVGELNAHGYRIATLFACGGDTKNPVFVREHADVTGCRIVLAREPEAVLLGAAILGAVASGDAASVLEAMAVMSKAGELVEAARGPVATFHAAKQRVFQRMYEDQLGYRGAMSSS
jgi:FGGY-family pentulose kinase